MRAVAINVGANTNEPGFRSPIYPDGSWEYVPIPETEPTNRPVPTYADLDLHIHLPDELRDRPVHLDPEFAEFPGCEAYTYGDPWGVKARPLLDLSADDLVCFYASLAPYDADGHPDSNTGAHPEWARRDWGIYLIGGFRLAIDPIPGEQYDSFDAGVRARFHNNAHRKRSTFDAAVLLLGDDRSGRLGRPIPLSGEGGTDPNALVTDLSSDSGAGPWWRRPLRFGPESTRRLLTSIERWNPPLS